MKRLGLLLPLLLTIAVLIGIAAFLFNSQTTLEGQIDAQETAQADLQATLVTVFDQRRAAEATLAAELEEAQAELTVLQDQVKELEPLATEVVEIRSIPIATPELASGDEDAPPQIRVTLREPESIWPINEPVDIIVSASHPIGIAAINIAVNGQPLLSESPFDPKLDISTIRWTPLEPGEYTITANATTIRGRTSEPVRLNLTVVDTSDPLALNEAILRRIERNVEELRGLDAVEPVEMQFLTPAEFDASVEDLVLDDYTPEDALLEVRVLSMFDFVSPDYPLYENTINGLSGVILGFYDPIEDKIFVINADDQIDTEEALTHAHEYMHALQDQYFSIEDIENPTLTRDERLALRSVGEGEAVLLEFLYQTRGYLTGEENSTSDPVFPTPESRDVPSFYLSDFSFPYVTGYEFVNGIYQVGGFDAVNELWETLPPSTEQIIHPELYLVDPPDILTVPDLGLADGWTLLEEGVMGEFYVQEYLSLYIGDEDEILTAAAGWGGDIYQVWRDSNSGEQAMVFTLSWDTEADLEEFESTYINWLDARMNGTETDPADGGACWNRSSTQICLIEHDGQHWIVRTETGAIQSQILDSINR